MRPQKVTSQAVMESLGREWLDTCYRCPRVLSKLADFLVNNTDLTVDGDVEAAVGVIVRYDAPGVISLSRACPGFVDDDCPLK